jgi:hypothetical protein
MVTPDFSRAFHFCPKRTPIFPATVLHVHPFNHSYLIFPKDVCTHSRRPLIDVNLLWIDVDRRRSTDGRLCLDTPLGFQSLFHWNIYFLSSATNKLLEDHPVAVVVLWWHWCHTWRIYVIMKFFIRESKNIRGKYHEDPCCRTLVPGSYSWKIDCILLFENLRGWILYWWVFYCFTFKSNALR